MSHADEYSELFQAHKRRARKAHTCTACYEPIGPGSTYHKYDMFYDGVWSHEKHCGRCRAIYERLCKEQPLEPIVLTLDCDYSWRDTFGQDEPPDVAALAFMLPCETSGGAV